MDEDTNIEQNKADERKDLFKSASSRLTDILLEQSENYQVIRNLLITGDFSEQALMLFDIITQMDTPRLLLIKDEDRIQAICNVYKCHISDQVRTVVLQKLKECRKERMMNIRTHNEMKHVRKMFVQELLKINENNNFMTVQR